MRERSEHSGLLVSEIVDVSGIYDDKTWLDLRQEWCRRDLKMLRAHGLVRCMGRPARWEVVR